MKGWMKNDVMYVKDLIDDNGNVKSYDVLYTKNDDKRDIIREMYIIVNNVIRKVKKFDLYIAPYVKIKELKSILQGKN